MELVSFKEQLKRYIYEASGTREPYSKMDYSAFMLAVFEKNDCMAGKSKSELKRQINRWLNAETIKRENLFLIGFGLDMDDKMLTKFLTLVLKESDFDFNDPKEVIFWHCRHTGKVLSGSNEYVREPMNSWNRRNRQKPITDGRHFRQCRRCIWEWKISSGFICII